MKFPVGSWVRRRGSSEVKQVVDRGEGWYHIAYAGGAIQYAQADAEGRFEPCNPEELSPSLWSDEEVIQELLRRGGSILAQFTDSELHFELKIRQNDRIHDELRTLELEYEAKRAALADQLIR